MGDYEDRYPEAYGRGEDPQMSTAQELKEAQSPRQTPNKMTANLRRLGLGTPAQRAIDPAPRTGWHHAPDQAATRMEPPGKIIEPTGPPGPMRPAGNFRGIGPRGYLRSPTRIYEDICDRLTENPFIDASDIEVSVTGAEVLLRGRVDSMTALRQAGEIAHETAGVAQLRNELIVQPTLPRNDSPGAQVNRAIGSPHR